jgi:hypothetical protein
MSISSISAVSSATSNLANAMQEANETPEATRKEAASGDQQAIRKLARQQERQAQSQPQIQTPQPGIGQAIELLA